MNKELIYDDDEYSDEGFLVPFGVVKKNIQNKLMTIEFWIDAGKKIVNNPKTNNVKLENYSTVYRFQNFNNSIEKYFSGDCVCAVGFSSDTNLMIGGFGLFGGRSENIAKIKLFDIGIQFHEKNIGDGELLAASDDITYKCKKGRIFPILFKVPVIIKSGRWYEFILSIQNLALYWQSNGAKKIS